MSEKQTRGAKTVVFLSPVFLVTQSNSSLFVTQKYLISNSRRCGVPSFTAISVNLAKSYQTCGSNTSLCTERQRGKLDDLQTGSQVTWLPGYLITWLPDYLVT